jgi:hypothetical protein
MEDRIREAVAAALKDAGAGDTAFAVEWPADLANGDYATNAAMAAAKALGKNPKALAEELVPRIAEALGDYAESVEVAAYSRMRLPKRLAKNGGKEPRRKENALSWSTPARIRSRKCTSATSCRPSSAKRFRASSKIPARRRFAIRTAAI